LDQVCHRHIVEVQQAIPAPLGYRGFPKSICTSVNHVVCHGIPGDRKLKQGDIVNVDVTVIKDGFHGDSSRMFHVGKPSRTRSVDELTYRAMWVGIRTVRPGASTSAMRSSGSSKRIIAQSCANTAARHRRGFHEDPQVLRYGARRGLELGLA
jgi:methionine aminopeptidase